MFFENIHTFMEDRHMKIAVGGSAANPPHFGHKDLVGAVVATGEFDQVRWIVSGDRPDKPGMIASCMRWKMGRLLFADDENVSVLYESDCAVPTVFVIENLKQCYPDAEIVWYCGGDHFVPRKQFDGKCDVLGFWNEGEYLFENQEFLIIPRKGLDMNALQLPRNYKILDVSIPDISSTDIRNRIRQKKSVDRFTEDKIIEYIHQKQLYQTM